MAGAPIEGPWRLAFVGAPRMIDACLASGVDASLETRFIAAASGARASAVDEVRGFEPDVVIVFDPSGGSSREFADRSAVSVAYLTRPPIGRDLTGFDRILVSDRAWASTVEQRAPVWRAVPLPVADHHFREISAPPDPAAVPRVLGGSVRGRDRLRRRAGGRLDLALDDSPDDTRRSDESWVTINLHDDGAPSFEHRVPLALAAGHLLLSEWLHPRHGLEPGIDYLEFRSGRHLGRLLAAVRDDPRPWHWMRVRGRRKADHFRASRVWPRIVADVIADVRAFGAHRAG